MTQEIRIPVSKPTPINQCGTWSIIYPSDNLTVLKWLENNTAEAYVAPVKTWEENRQAEYPTIAELTIALYDTDDKAALEKRRSDVKAKYPKPS